MVEQVTRGLIAASLVGAVLLTGVWWLVADHAKTMAVVLLALLATIVIWAVLYRLFVYGIKRMVRSRIAGRGP